VVAATATWRDGLPLGPSGLGTMKMTALLKKTTGALVIKATLDIPVEVVPLPASAAPIVVRRLEGARDGSHFSPGLANTNTHSL
jgi:hypothetical protein